MRLALALAALATGCALGPRHLEARHPDGTLARAGPLVDGLQHGEWTFWYPSGTVQARGSYDRDVRTGEWSHWYENGALRMRGAYHGERQEGLWEFWHDDGSPSCRGEYRDGREHGEWSFHHRGGALRQRGVFWSGRRELRWTEHHPDGRVASDGTWLRDRPVGAWTHGDASGATTSVAYELPAGIEHVVERWDDGGVRREGFLRDGLADGVWVSRHRSGALRALVEFEAGLPRGELHCRSDGGALVARGPLADCRPDGTWRVGEHGTEVVVALVREPLPPWDRQWSDATVAGVDPPIAVAERWLAELSAPREARPLPPAGPPAIAERGDAEAPRVEALRLEAPTDPGEWTQLERDELETLRRYLRDGWLPRHHAVGGQYGVRPGGTRLGDGDPDLAQAIVGRELPVTRFRTADGELLDLASLRGQRVLLVMLAGFKSKVCVSCFAQTREIAAAGPRWDELECAVVVMFPGRKSRLAAFIEACDRVFGDRPPPFRMIYDPDLSLAQALGLLGNLARPAAFVLDREGIVRHAYVAESETNIADRPSTADLVRWLEKLP